MNASNTAPIPPAIDQNNRLLVSSGYEFPKICLRSGARDNLRPFPIKTTWTPPLAYLLLIFPGILFGAIIISLWVNRKAEFTAWISEAEHRKRTKWKAIVMACMITPPVLVAIAAFLGAPSDILGPIALLLPISWVVAVILNQRKLSAKISPKRIEPNGLVTLKGVPAFLLEEIRVKTLTPPALNA
jgi:hypothetical protein